MRFDRFTTVRALLAAGVVTLSAAACTSQGIVRSGSGEAAAIGSASAPSTAPPTASDSNQTAPQTSKPEPSSSDSPPPSGDSAVVHKQSETVTKGGFELKVNSLQLPYKPSADLMWMVRPGTSWLALDFSVTNVSGQPLMFSSLGAFDLRDNNNHEYGPMDDAMETLPDGKAFQDHTMQPNETASGEVVFGIDEHAVGFLLTFKGNVWQNNGQDDWPVIRLNP